MYNKILTNTDRKKYSRIIEDMYTKVPDMMARKIPEANVQQAFVVDFIVKKAKPEDKILCVGSYEDTAYEYLKLEGFNVIGICPEYDVDLHTFIEQNKDKTFNIIFSISVMEHVKDDTQFIEDICKLMKKGSLAVVTVDFKEDYRADDNRFNKKPSVDYRLYTSKDYERIETIIQKYGCVYLDEFRVDAAPDFTYEGVKYSFSTMVFKKIK